MTDIVTNIIVILLLAAPLVCWVIGRQIVNRRLDWD